MKASQAQQQALLALLSRIYDEIRGIEEHYQIRARPEDFRPRIDYFHDAIRELTTHQGDGFERVGRMSVESLAADAVMLRQIREKPLIRHPELAIPLSPSTAVMKPPAMPPAAANMRVDVSVAARLAEGYGHYALLFVSLLAYPAERNYMNRMNECVSEQDMIDDVIAATADQNKDAPIDIDTALAHITDPALYKRLLAALKTAHKQKRVVLADVIEAVKQEKQGIRAKAAALESTHMRFASSQLVLYQDAQSLVKKMAGQGLNIVGDFVESAIRETQRGGRGF